MPEVYSKWKWTLADVSWRDMLAQDPYYWLSNSFQYSENINCDDELHGIKLSQRIMTKHDCASCQLISAGDIVFAVHTPGHEIQPGEGYIKYFRKNSNPNGEDDLDLNRFPGGTISNVTGQYAAVTGNVWEAVIFQDYLRASFSTGSESMFTRVNVWSLDVPAPSNRIYDHIEDSDESIGSISVSWVTTLNWNMWPGIFQVLNFNNTRLVCGVGQDLRVYYPELDHTGEQQFDPNLQVDRTVEFWETGWKKVQHFEAGCNIVGLTCDFEYLKVRVTDEGWNTKMYYYPGNNDLRNTFVYNIIDMTGTKVLRTYNINWIDYFTASLDGTDGYITFNKVIWDTPVQIFKQRGWLTKYDINQKAWYFVWPTTWTAEYQDGNFYVGDAYWVFKFAFNPEGYDTGYLKWKIRDHKDPSPGTVGLCIAWNFVFISDQYWLRAMRLYDTGVDWYEEKGILISREMEWDFGWCVAKIIDELRCHFELNNLRDEDGDYMVDEDDTGTIDIYLSPNNLWQFSDPEVDSTGWYHVMTLSGLNRGTRFEAMTKFSQLPDGNDYTNPVFEYDRETITYCVVIKRWSNLAQRTPVVREVLMSYHLKGKTNQIYDINNH